MIDHILAIVLVMLFVLINTMFVKSIFPKSSFTKTDIIWLVSAIILCSVSSIFLKEITIVKTLITITSLIVFSKKVFGITYKKSVIVNLLFVGMLTTIEGVALVVYQSLISKSGYSNLTNSNGAAVIEIGCYLLLLILIAIINMIRKKNNLSRLDVKGWISFVMYPLIAIGVVLSMLYIPSESMNQEVFSVLLIFAVSMLFLSVLQFFFIDNIIQRETEIRDKQILIEQAEHINKMYQSLSKEREEQKARSHDYCNHLNVILAMMDSRNEAESVNYIKEQLNKEAERIDIIDTGNVVINAVLNIKYQEAKKNKIVMPLLADDLSDISISENDLVTILTNILDNAIEATSQCSDKKITMRIHKKDKTLCIDSTNTYMGKDYEEVSHYTTKKDSVNHGYGIANIRQTVSKNNGECIIEARDGIFRIMVTIPLT